MIITAVLALVAGIFYYRRLSIINSLFNIKSKVKAKKKKGESRLFSKFKEKLYIYLMYKNKLGNFKRIYGLHLVFLFCVCMLFLKVNKISLALLMPLLIHFFVLKIVEGLTTNMNSIIKNNLPRLINHMVKVFSKTNDLMVVLYESSREMEEPLKSLILNLSRNMVTQNNKKSLLEFAERIDNIWIYSFIFLLINYKETSSKEDVVHNLLSLSEIIEERNHLNSKMIADRKPIIIINYLLLVAGAVIFTGNLFYNPIMIKFLLNTFTGIVCLILGVSCFFLTILVNIKLAQE